MSTADVTLTDGGTMYAGADATLYFKAAHLRAALRLFARTGIKPTRGVGGRQLMALATEITGKPYKARAYDQAVADLDVWLQTMRGALHVEDQREGAA